MTAGSNPLRFGAWLAILAAVSFGVTAPLVKIAGAGAGPFITAATSERREWRVCGGRRSMREVADR